MFDNIVDKIKTVAQVFCWVGIILSVISGLISIFSGGDLIGIITIIVGVLSSWVSSIIVYGFGQLIEDTNVSASNSAIIAENLNILVKDKENN